MISTSILLFLRESNTFVDYDKDIRHRELTHHVKYNPMKINFPPLTYSSKIWHVLQRNQDRLSDLSIMLIKLLLKKDFSYLITYHKLYI